MVANSYCRVVVLEINEISWELMREWTNGGELPGFRRLRRYGTCAQTRADEEGGPDGLLEPWVTWTTLYTGVPQPEHGMKVLEQPPESVRYPRVWDLADQAGKRVGVFGSVGSWPPKKVNGFFVPGSFSPDSATHPADLSPIQDLNLRYTRAHAPGARQPGVAGLIGSAWQLRKLGLDASTVLSVAKTLAGIKLRPSANWRKVSLQPVVNWAFFRELYRRFKPDFATFHTNHVAHYQHRFLRAWKPEMFADPTDHEEVKRFGDAVHYGYQTADRLVRQSMRLCDADPNVVLCVASSMGQQPFVPERYGRVAPATCRIKSIERLIELLGLEGRCEFFSTMAPQWNLRIADESLRREAIRHLKAARYQPLGKSMYEAIEVDRTIVVTPISLHGLGAGSTCAFPTLVGAPVFPFEEFVVQADETRKSGCHDPIGMVAFYGRRVRAGGDLGEINNLDLAPTFLSLMGIEAPDYMPGRNLTSTVLTDLPPRVPVAVA